MREKKVLLKLFLVNLKQFQIQIEKSVNQIEENKMLTVL